MVGSKNKTILLHEHKRHTVRLVASTCSAVLSGWRGGREIPVMVGYPSLVLARGLPQDRDTPLPGTGVPPPGTGLLLHLGLEYPSPHLELDYPPGIYLGPLEVLWDGNGVPSQVWTNTHTPVKNSTFLIPWKLAVIIPPVL